MTQTKLEIIGPYTPEHEGPFCTRDGRPVRVLCSDMKNEFSIVAIVLDEDGKETVSTFINNGNFCRSGVDKDRDLMNAREVPVAREWYLFFGGIFDTKEEAMQRAGGDFSSIIHVREVLLGEGA